MASGSTLQIFIAASQLLLQGSGRARLRDTLLLGALEEIVEVSTRLCHGTQLPAWLLLKSSISGSRGPALGQDTSLVFSVRLQAFHAHIALS